MWQLHVWIQFGPQCAGGQAETTACMERSVRACRSAPSRESSVLLPHLLAHERLAMCIRTEKARCSESNTQMAMLTATATIITDAVFSDRLHSNVGRAKIISSVSIKFLDKGTWSSHVPRTILDTEGRAEDKTRSRPPSETLHFSRGGRQGNQLTNQPASQERKQRQQVL